jgi:hypothetical protein
MGMFEKDDRGVERCQRVKEAAIENVTGDPSKGYHNAKAICNRPASLNISENRKFCSDCDKQAPVGNVNPRVTNSAGIKLSKKELEECGVTEDPSLKPAPAKKVRAERKPREAKPAVEAKVSKVKKDAVTLEVSLSLLEENEDVAAILIRRTIEAFGELPVTNFAESKRLIKLEEKLRSLLES